MSAFRFPAIVLLNYILSSAGYSVAAFFTAGDLSSVSARVEEWWKVAGLLAWKAIELAVGWWGEYDGTI